MVSSICLTEEELTLVERMRADIEAETGFKISRNQLIKKLLFEAWGSVKGGGGGSYNASLQRSSGPYEVSVV